MVLSPEEIPIWWRKQIVFSNLVLDRHFDFWFRRKIPLREKNKTSFSNLNLHTFMIHISHIKFLFTNTMLYSVIFKKFHFQKLPTTGPMGPTLVPSSSANYKTVKTKYAVSTKLGHTLPDWIIFDYFYCYLHQFWLFVTKSRLFKNVLY